MRALLAPACNRLFAQRANTMKYIKLKAQLEEGRKEKSVEMYLKSSNYDPICLKV